MKKFEKHFELGIEVIGHNKEEDFHVFKIKFDRDISQYKPTTILHYKAFHVGSMYWYRDDVYSPEQETEIYVSDESNGLIETIFGNSDKYEETIRDLCIDYCREHSLPEQYMSTDVDGGGSVGLLSDIKEHIEKGEMDLGDVNVIGDFSDTSDDEYDNPHPYNLIKYTLRNDIFILDNIFLKKEYKLDGGKINYKNILDYCIKFDKEWNEIIDGKFDWKVFEEWLSKTNASVYID